MVIYRLPREISVARGRSFCPKCKKQIHWYDNIPLLSFAMLGGKCRQCGKSISFRYPLVEGLTGILFAIVAWRGVEGLGGLGGIGGLEITIKLVLVACLVAIVFIDLEWLVIPDELLITAGVGYACYYLLTISLIGRIGQIGPITNPPLSAAGAYGFIWVFWYFTRGKGMGFGDVKMAGLMGFVLGWPEIALAFYVAFISGGVVSIVLLLIKKAKFGQKIPFGPFLAFGTYVTLIWGKEIITRILPI